MVMMLLAVTASRPTSDGLRRKVMKIIIIITVLIPYVPYDTIGVINASF